MNDNYKKCDEIYYDYYISDTNYVFAALNPDPNSMFYQDDNDYFDWLFSCSCYYDEDKNKSVPKYDLRDSVWFNESNIANNFDNICHHIKKCYLARRIYRNHIFDTTNPLPSWVKNTIGSNYVTQSADIMNDLKPIRWGNNTMRHGIGKVKIHDYDKYRVYRFSHNVWKCNCRDFAKFGNCIHIVKSKHREEHLQNRRVLCINLARKYLEQLYAN